MFTLLCYEDIFDCLEDCVQEQCCKGETFQTVTLEVVLWFCILFWLVDVSVVVMIEKIFTLLCDDDFLMV